MLPSVKTLEREFPGKGKTIRKLLESDSAVKKHPAVVEDYYENWRGHHSPTLREMRLHAVNAELEGCGVEYIAHKDDGFHERDMLGLEYVNMGDTYVCTIIYDRSRHTWRCCDWGSIVEARPNTYL